MRLTTLLAGLLCFGALALADGSRGRFTPPSFAGIFSGDAELATNKKLFLDGAIHTSDIYFNGTNVIVESSGALITPNLYAAGGAITMLGNDLTANGYGWFKGGIYLGANPNIAFSVGTPTLTTACTSPTVTNGTVTSFQMDVGTSCTGIKAVVLTLPAAGNGWECHGYNKTTSTMRLDQSADTTTTATLGNYAKNGGALTDLVDGADLVISCTGR